MVDLVSLAETKQLLRYDVDATDDDAALTLLISAASERVIAYLDVRAADVIGEDGMTTSARVKTATIMLVGYLFKNPDRDPDQDFDLGKLPKNVSSLLYQLRDPVVR